MDTALQTAPLPPRTLLEEVLQGEALSVRELEALVDVALGLTSKQAARKRIYSYDTVKEYRARALAKLGARNSAHAVAIGKDRGLI